MAEKEGSATADDATFLSINSVTISIIIVKIQIVHEKMDIVLLYQKGFNRNTIWPGLAEKSRILWSCQEMALTLVIGFRRFAADNFVLSSRDKNQS